MHHGLKKIFVFLCLIMASSVHAYQWGNVDLTPVALLQTKYDDNITYAHTNIKKDFITLFSLGLEAAYEGKLESFLLKSNLKQEVYASENDFNNLAQDVSLIAKKELSEYDRLTLTNLYIHADQPSSFEDEFGRTSGRYDFHRNIFTSAFVHDFTEQVSGHLKYRNAYYNPTREDLSDSIVHNPGAQIDYKLSSETIGSLFYDYALRSFKPGGDTTSHGFDAGLKQYFTTQLYLDARAGADFITLVDDSDTIEPSYYIALINEIDETTVAKISYTKDYIIRDYSSELFDSWRVAISWGKEILARLRFAIEVFVGGGEYTTSEVNEDLTGLTTGLSYDLSDNAMVDLRYLYSKQDSSAPASGYEKNMVSLGFTFKF